MEPHATSAGPQGHTTAEDDAPVDTDWLTEFTHLKEARHLAELEGDRDLVLRVSLAGYKGREWLQLADRLVGYGLRITEAWIMNDRIRERCRSRTGHRLPLLPHRPTRQDAADMAADTVGIAFARFVSGVLVPGRWNPTEGATLTTFSVGQILLRYPNVHRRWVVRLRREACETTSDDLEPLLPHGRQAHVEETVLDGMVAGEHIARLEKRLPARTIEIATYRDAGYTWDEVAELTGLSVSAAKSVLNRARAGGRPR